MGGAVNEPLLTVEMVALLTLSGGALATGCGPRGMGWPKAAAAAAAVVVDVFSFPSEQLEVPFEGFAPHPKSW